MGEVRIIARIDHTDRTKASWLSDVQQVFIPFRNALKARGYAINFEGGFREEDKVPEA